jgi:LytR cell envelope-related transcriptional attenuator
MARQQRGGGGDVARGAGYAALLGALLIGVAVVIGIVLLQIGDNNKNGPASATNGHPTTTTTKRHATTSTTTRSGPTSSTVPQRPPSAVRIIVLNGGAASGKAGDMSDSLKVKGYTNQPKPANDWTGHTQTGDSVYCGAGFDREGTALAIAVGSSVPLHIPYPTPPPPFSADVDCVVVVGASGTTTTT